MYTYRYIEPLSHPTILLCSYAAAMFLWKVDLKLVQIQNIRIYMGHYSLGILGHLNISMKIIVDERNVPQVSSQ